MIVVDSQNNRTFTSRKEFEQGDYYRSIQGIKFCSVVGLAGAVSIVSKELLSREPSVAALFAGIIVGIVSHDLFTMARNDEKYIDNLIVRFKVNVGDAFGLNSRTDQLFKNTLVAKFLFG